MFKIDMNTGELINGMSSPFISEQEAAESASFGKYLYDPKLNGQQQMIYPGNYGYNTQPVVGLGANPYMNNNFQQQNPYAYNNFQQQNPYTYNNFYNNNFQQYYQPKQNFQQFIPGMSLGGDYLFSYDIQDQMLHLQMQYLHDIEEAQVNAGNNYFSNYGNYGYNNYYGIPYYNNTSVNSVNMEYQKKIMDIQNKAKEARYDLNVKLAILAHKGAHDGITEEQIKQDYKGRYINSFNSYNLVLLDEDVFESSTVSQEDIMRNKALENSVEFDNSGYYQQMFTNARNDYLSIIPECNNLKDFLDNAWALNLRRVQDAELARRRNLNSLYSDNGSIGFRDLLRLQIAERNKTSANNNLNNQIIMPPPINNSGGNKTLVEQMFPTLANSGTTLSEDGTLTIRCNFGSNAGQNYFVNENESKYSEDKQRFLDSITNAMSYKGG